MTRINCIKPEMLLDEHLQAAVREGLRPVNEVLSGKDNIKNAPEYYKLSSGHVLFCRKHLLFTKRQFEKSQQEYHKRGFKGFEYDCVDLSQLDDKFLNDYTPTMKDIRTNLARIVERWRKRTKPYHFKGKIIDNNKDFRLYYKTLKQYCIQGE